MSVTEVEQIAATPTSVEDLTTRTPEDLIEKLGAKLDEPPVPKVNRCLICRSVFASFNELKQHVTEAHKPRKQGYLFFETQFFCPHISAGGDSFGVGWLHNQNRAFFVSLLKCVSI